MGGINMLQRLFRMVGRHGLILRSTLESVGIEWSIGPRNTTRFPLWFWGSNRKSTPLLRLVLFTPETPASPTHWCLRVTVLRHGWASLIRRARPMAFLAKSPVGQGKRVSAPVSGFFIR